MPKACVTKSIFLLETPSQTVLAPCCPKAVGGKGSLTE